MNTTEIRELDIAELDQVSGGTFFDLMGLNPIADFIAVAVAVGKIAGKTVGGGSTGAGPAGGGAGPVPA